jgi:malate dehydrogenase (oxaloacetate-decarboxylating)
MATKDSISQGRDALSDPRLNRGTAFTLDESSAFGARARGSASGGGAVAGGPGEAFVCAASRAADRLAKNDLLAALHDRNEVLSYKLLEEHLEEMLPVVYDPKYSHPAGHRVEGPRSRRYLNSARAPP